MPVYLLGGGNFRKWVSLDSARRVLTTRPWELRGQTTSCYDKSVVHDRIRKRYALRMAPDGSIATPDSSIIAPDQLLVRYEPGAATYDPLRFYTATGVAYDLMALMLDPKKGYLLLLTEVEWRGCHRTRLTFHAPTGF